MLGDSVPPWLNVQPSDYLRAVQAGGAAGLGIAEAKNRAREAATRTAEAQRQAAQREWEFNERMRQAAAEQASGDAFKQQQLAQQGKYQEGMLNYHQGQLGETSAHNQAMEEIDADKVANMLARGQARVVDDPSAPGYLFLENPSGARSVLQRPEKDLTEAQKNAIIHQGFNSFKPLNADENVEGPGYHNRTNYYGNVLRKLGALPQTEFSPANWSGMNIEGLGQTPAPTEGALGNSDWMSRPTETRNEVLKPLKNGRKAIFDADTKEFIRYAD